MKFFKLILKDEEDNTLEEWKFSDITLLFPRWWGDFKERINMWVYQPHNIIEKRED